MLTPCSAFYEAFTFLLTNQREIFFEQYDLNKDNYPNLVKTIPFNFSKSQKGQFKITDTLYGIYEIVPFGIIPFNDKQFPFFLLQNQIKLVVF